MYYPSSPHRQKVDVSLWNTVRNPKPVTLPPSKAVDFAVVAGSMAQEALDNAHQSIVDLFAPLPPMSVELDRIENMARNANRKESAGDINDYLLRFDFAACRSRGFQSSMFTYVPSSQLTFPAQDLGKNSIGANSSSLKILKTLGAFPDNPYNALDHKMREIERLSRGYHANEGGLPGLSKEAITYLTGDPNIKTLPSPLPVPPSVNDQHQNLLNFKNRSSSLKSKLLSEEKDNFKDSSPEKPGLKITFNPLTLVESCPIPLYATPRLDSSSGLPLPAATQLGLTTLPSSGIPPPLVNPFAVDLITTWCKHSVKFTHLGIEIPSLPQIDSKTGSPQMTGSGLHKKLSGGTFGGIPLCIPLHNTPITNLSNSDLADATPLLETIPRIDVGAGLHKDSLWIPNPALILSDMDAALVKTQSAKIVLYDEGGLEASLNCYRPTSKGLGIPECELKEGLQLFDSKGKLLAMLKVQIASGMNPRNGTQGSIIQVARQMCRLLEKKQLPLFVDADFVDFRNSPIFGSKLKSPDILSPPDNYNNDLNQISPDSPIINQKTSSNNKSKPRPSSYQNDFENDFGDTKMLSPLPASQNNRSQSKLDFASPKSPTVLKQSFPSGNVENSPQVGGAPVFIVAASSRPQSAEAPILRPSDEVAKTIWASVHARRLSGEVDLQDLFNAALNGPIKHKDETDYADDKSNKKQKLSLMGAGSLQSSVNNANTLLNSEGYAPHLFNLCVYERKSTRYYQALTLWERMRAEAVNLNEIISEIRDLKALFGGGEKNEDILETLTQLALKNGNGMQNEDFERIKAMELREKTNQRFKTIAKFSKILQELTPSGEELKRLELLQASYKLNYSLHNSSDKYPQEDPNADKSKLPPLDVEICGSLAAAIQSIPHAALKFRILHSYCDIQDVNFVMVNQVSNFSITCNLLRRDENFFSLLSLVIKAAQTLTIKLRRNLNFDDLSANEIEAIQKSLHAIENLLPSQDMLNGPLTIQKISRLSSLRVNHKKNFEDENHNDTLLKYVARVALHQKPVLLSFPSRAIPILKQTADNFRLHVLEQMFSDAQAELTEVEADLIATQEIHNNSKNEITMLKPDSNTKSRGSLDPILLLKPKNDIGQLVMKNAKSLLLRAVDDFEDTVRFLGENPSSTVPNIQELSSSNDIHAPLRPSTYALDLFLRGVTDFLTKFDQDARAIEAEANSEQLARIQVLRKTTQLALDALPKKNLQDINLELKQAQQGRKAAKNLIATSTNAVSDLFITLNSKPKTQKNNDNTSKSNVPINPTIGSTHGLVHYDDDDNDDDNKEDSQFPTEKKLIPSVIDQKSSKRLSFAPPPLRGISKNSIDEELASISPPPQTVFDDLTSNVAKSPDLNDSFANANGSLRNGHFEFGQEDFVSAERPNMEDQLQGWKDMDIEIQKPIADVKRTLIKGNPAKAHSPPLLKDRHSFKPLKWDKSHTIASDIDPQPKDKSFESIMEVQSGRFSSNAALLRSSELSAAESMTAVKKENLTPLHSRQNNGDVFDAALDNFAKQKSWMMTDDNIRKKPAGVNLDDPRARLFTDEINENLSLEKMQSNNLLNSSNEGSDILNALAKSKHANSLYSSVKKSVNNSEVNEDDDDDEDENIKASISNQKKPPPSAKKTMPIPNNNKINKEVEVEDENTDENIKDVHSLTIMNKSSKDDDFDQFDSLRNRSHSLKTVNSVSNFWEDEEALEADSIHTSGGNKKIASSKKLPLHNKEPEKENSLLGRSSEYPPPLNLSKTQKNSLNISLEDELDQTIFGSASTKKQHSKKILSKKKSPNDKPVEIDNDGDFGFTTVNSKEFDFDLDDFTTKSLTSTKSNSAAKAKKKVLVDNFDEFALESIENNFEAGKATKKANGKSPTTPTKKKAANAVKKPDNISRITPPTSIASKTGATSQKTQAGPPPPLKKNLAATSSLLSTSAKKNSTPTKKPKVQFE